MRFLTCTMVLCLLAAAEFEMQLCLASVLHDSAHLQRRLKYCVGWCIFISGLQKICNMG